MPRTPRLEAPGAIHHVVAKGVDRDPIVRDDSDRRLVLNHLARATARQRWRCLAYCLMDTHLHLLVQTEQPNLGRGMQWLCGRYAQAFNVRWDRAGHLFGRRFFSGRVETDEHFASALVYVFLNPSRAGLVERPEAWPWSSYAATMGLVESPPFLDVRDALGHVHPDARQARAMLHSAVTDGARRAAAAWASPAVGDVSGVADGSSGQVRGSDPWTGPRRFPR